VDELAEYPRLEVGCDHDGSGGDQMPERRVGADLGEDVSPELHVIDRHVHIIEIGGKHVKTVVRE